jgi:hypothetical protein
MSLSTSSPLSQFLASSLRTEVADSQQALVLIADLPHVQCVDAKSSLAILNIFSRPFAHYDWHRSLL